jgi:hypothetical protein
MNRLTITLDNELYAMARAYEVANQKSISKAIGDLLRQRTPGSGLPAMPGRESDKNSYYDPILGIQVSRCDKSLTEEEVRRSLDDEDVRHLEMMGLSPGEIERSLAG